MATVLLRRSLLSAARRTEVRNVRSASTLLTSNNAVSTHNTLEASRNNNISHQQLRSMGSGGGARGARGHGWFVNFLEGKGGRHLQGEYYDRPSVEECEVWNSAVFALGSTKCYMDVKLEPLAGASSEESVSTTTRLELELASTALPLASENFVKLLQDGYLNSTLHRVEKKVGLMGGLVNTGKKPLGMCHESLRIPHSPTNMDVSKECLVLHHLPGTLTMVSPRVGEIDSRFLLLSEAAPHLDGGNAIPIGRLTANSLQQVQQWENTLITHKGRPTNVVLRIVECGVVSSGESNSSAATPSEPAKQSMSAGASE